MRVCVSVPVAAVVVEMHAGRRGLEVAARAPVLSDTEVELGEVRASQHALEMGPRRLRRGSALCLCLRLQPVFDNVEGSHKQGRDEGAGGGSGAALEERELGEGRAAAPGRSRGCHSHYRYSDHRISLDSLGRKRGQRDKV